MFRKTVSLFLFALLAASILPDCGDAEKTPAVKCSISGQVTYNGTGFAGVTIRLTGAKKVLAITDINGEFCLNGVPVGTYVVTPELQGQALQPSTRTIEVAGEPIKGLDFTLVTRSLGGTVTLNGKGYPRCSVTLSTPPGDKILTTVADQAGRYSFSGLLSCTYQIRPSIPGQSLSPFEHTVMVTDTDAAGIDFVVNTYTLSGRVTLNKAGFPTCAVRLIPPGGKALTALTDASGQYSFPGLLEGAYRVNASVPGQSLTPSERRVVIAGSDLSENDFALVTYSVNGRVTLAGTGYSGATVTLLGDRKETVVTDEAGRYSFSGLPRGSYTVVPEQAGQSFTPGERRFTFTSASAGALDADFALVTYFAAGRVTLNNAGFPGVIVTLSGDRTSLKTVTGPSGEYAFFGQLRGTYKITPFLPDQVFLPMDRKLSLVEGDSRGNDFSLRTFDISGRALYNGRPLKGMTVLLKGAVSLITATAADGRYSFKGILNGTYTLTPRYRNQTVLPDEQKVVISGSSPESLDFFIPFLVWHVNLGARGQTADGLTWETAFRHPQDALAASSMCDKIWIARGTYGPRAPESSRPLLEMKDGVEVYGGFAGHETTLFQRALRPEDTVLDGQEVVPHVVVGANNSRLDGFTVTGGRATNDNGAGMLIAGKKTVYVSNCIFAGNSVKHGSTGGKGAGMYCFDSTGFLENCRFQFNSVSYVMGQLGGGGLCCERSSFTVDHCLFNGNKALFGGGLALVGSNLVLTNSTFSNNYSFDGSGMMVLASAPRISNCVFHKNIASHNAVIYNDLDSSPKLKNCTIVQNSGGWWTGGLLNARDSQATISNSIIWGNSGAQIYHYLAPDLSTVTYSDIQAGYPGPGNINANPRFLDIFRNDFRLTRGSACIDTGDKAAAVPDLSEDLEGNPRVVDGNGDKVAEVDMGAFEYVP